jgi:Apea-like HEPN
MRTVKATPKALWDALYKSLAQAINVSPHAEIDRGMPLAIELMRAFEQKEKAKPELVRLAEMLQEMPYLKQIDGKYVTAFNMTMPFTTMQVCGWLLTRAQTIGVDSAIKELKSFFKKDEVVYVEVFALSGCKPPKSINIGSIQIMDWSAIPDSTTKNSIARASWQIGGGSPPTAALVRKHSRKLKFHDTAGSVGHSFTDVDELLDLARCLLITQKIGVKPIYHWIAPLIDVPLSAGGVSIYGQTNMFVPVDSSQWSPKKINNMAANFRKLDPKFRERLRLAIDRLGLSIQNFNPVSAALDLGIAAESLLLENDNQEIKHKFALRAAKFIGGGLDEKKKNFETMKEVYDLRSSVAHSGQIRKNRQEKAREIISEGQSLTISVLEKLVKNREGPDWDTMALK